MTTKRVKSAYWDFVFNNETDESSKSLILLLTQWTNVLDAGFQHEVAPTTGTKHLQGWLKLDNRQYKSYLLRSRLNMGDWEDKISFRPARNPKALVSYCQKMQAEAHDYWCKSEELAKIEAVKSQERDAARKELRSWRNIIPTVHSEYPIILPDYESDEGYSSDE